MNLLKTYSITLEDYIQCLYPFHFDVDPDMLRFFNRRIFGEKLLTFSTFLCNNLMNHSKQCFGSI